jgi:hypothetical protein
MDIIEARKIYQNQNGHTKQELGECLNVLNEAMQPIVLSRIQFLALGDAINRVGNDKRLR